MKKIVAYLLPVADSEPGAVETVTDVAQLPVAVAHNDEALPSHDGAMKLEAIVSDAQARRIVAALLDEPHGPDGESSLEKLLQEEINIAGPDAHDLFKRIVIGVERELISRVYSECNGVKTRAAARLGIDRNTLHKKLRQYQLAED